MNGFVIADGTYVKVLTKKSKEVAKNIGKVNVRIGGTAVKCHLPMPILTKLLLGEN